jgi:hypothetical protein
MKMIFTDLLKAMQHDPGTEEEPTFDHAVGKHIENESGERAR